MSMSKQTTEIADYIHTIAAQLAALAEAEKLHVLAHLLRMAEIQAETEAAGETGTPSRTTVTVA
jgi:hypothetical protein